MTRIREFITASAICAITAGAALPVLAATIDIARPAGGASAVTPVRDGCGEGRYRNQHGHCHWIPRQATPYGQDMGNSDSGAYRGGGMDDNMGGGMGGSGMGGGGMGGGGMGGGGMGGGGMGGGHGH